MTIDVVAPGPNASTLQLYRDTGTASDFITTVPEQYVGITEVGATVSLRVDNGAFVAPDAVAHSTSSRYGAVPGGWFADTFESSFQRIPFGPHQVQVRATDLAGNVGQWSAPREIVSTNSNPPSMTIASVGTITENSSAAPFTVTLTETYYSPIVPVQFTSTGTATAEADFDPRPVSYPLDAVTVPLNLLRDDTVYEPDETLTLTLQRPAPGAQPATVTILENDPPTLSGLVDRTSEASQTLAVAFAVGNFAPGVNVPVSATSSNQALVANGAISLSGSGANRMLSFTPSAGVTGATTITVVAGHGLATVTRSFVLTVVVAGLAPTVSGLSDVTILEDAASTSMSFTIGDDVTSATALTVTATTLNQSLLPDAALSLSGTGASRTLTVTPPLNLFASVPINVAVTDEVGLTTVTSFLLSFQPVDDAPVNLVPTSVTTNEDVPVVFSKANGNAIRVSDEPASGLRVTITSNGGNLTVPANGGLQPSSLSTTYRKTVVSYVGSASAINAALDGLRFVTDHDYLGAASVAIETSDVGVSNFGYASGVSAFSSEPFAGASNRLVGPPDNQSWLPSSLGTQFVMVGFAESLFADGAIITKENSSSTYIQTIEAIDENSVAHLVWSGTDTAGATVTYNWPRTSYLVKELKVSLNRTSTGSESIDAIRLQGVRPDFGPLVDTDSITININPVEDVPYFQSSPISLPKNAVAYQSIINITDAETAVANLTISYAVDNSTLFLPSGVVVEIDPSNTSRFRILLTPQTDRSGNANLLISATDEANNTVRHVVPITVVGGQNAPVIGAASTLTLLENTSIEIPVSDIETPGNQLVVVTSASNTTLFPANSLTVVDGPNGRAVRITPQANLWGASTVTIRVDDADGASAIKTIAVTVTPRMDFGDAPDTDSTTSKGDYQTTLANDGPRHHVGGPRLGALVDFEAGPTLIVEGSINRTGSYGDNVDGPDEDGVFFNALLRTSPGNPMPDSVIVNASQVAQLDAWLDFNQDGDFADAGEQIAANAAVSSGDNAIAFSVPAGAPSGKTFARFRISTAGGLAPTGFADDGEVEDVAVVISTIEALSLIETSILSHQIPGSTLRTSNDPSFYEERTGVPHFILDPYFSSLAVRAMLAAPSLSSTNRFELTTEHLNFWLSRMLPDGTIPRVVADNSGSPVAIAVLASDGTIYPPTL